MMIRAALVVVDLQNDFCPPDGSLAIAGGRDIVPMVNRLLRSPSIAFKVATQDFHPADHISFASNHSAPNNVPFESYIEMQNIAGGKPEETMQQRLWPVHCVQGTKGAEFVDELDLDKLDLVVRKGMDKRVEMYSAFADAFGNQSAGSDSVSHDLAHVLHEKNITDVYVVGLAGDYCVKESALGAARAGFRTFYVEPCAKCADLDAWPKVKSDLEAADIKVVDFDSNELKRLILD